MIPVEPEPAVDPSSGATAVVIDGPAPAIPSDEPGPIAPPPHVPRPKPVLVTERLADGWGTNSLRLERRPGGLFLTARHPAGADLHVHLTAHHVEQLLQLCRADAGLLWRALSAIPLERPLPSRALEDELRLLLTTFAGEIRLAMGPR